MGEKYKYFKVGGPKWMIHPNATIESQLHIYMLDFYVYPSDPDLCKTLLHISPIPVRRNPGHRKAKGYKSTAKTFWIIEVSWRSRSAVHIRNRYTYDRYLINAHNSQDLRSVIGYTCVGCCAEMCERLLVSESLDGSVIELWLCA